MIKKLRKIDRIREVLQKLYTNEELTYKDYEFILSIALILLNYYGNDDKKKEYFEFSYIIFLKYGLITGDYRPLSFFSYNYGFFPIYRWIMNHDLLSKNSIDNVIFDSYVDTFLHKGYIETKEQHDARVALLNSENDCCYVAPTSSGKSSIVIEMLKKYKNANKSIIVVPSKSLLYQTYSELRKNIKDRKIICHNDMYCGEEKFVAVLTQERGLRLLESNEGIIVDYLFIDEAHNLFSNDPRNILLSRLIKNLKNQNPNIRCVYLSPFINDAHNLILKDNRTNVIDEQKIQYNIKEPQIFELRKNGFYYQYNRFFDEFYKLGGTYDLFSYINAYSKQKNFIFLRSPKKIESFAKELYNHTPIINSHEKINELKNILKKYVHEKFIMIDMIDHGIVYLHAKIPDVIKTYLEYQFKVNESIKYIVANSVILEGINLPIDNLFILDAHSQTSIKLNNLIGRVNRLNYVFSENGSLNKLLPCIHFINSKYYRNKMENKIIKLYKVHDDYITNPLLSNFDIENAKVSKTEKEKLIKKNNSILENEETLTHTTNDEKTLLKQKILKSGVDQLVSLNDKNIDQIYNRLNSYQKSEIRLDILNLIKFLLVDGIEVINNEFKRLENDAAIKYYKMFISFFRKDGLNTLIKKQIKYYKQNIENGETYIYVGPGYGDSLGKFDEKSNKGLVYIDMSNKEESDLINIIIVKTKIEQDFISYQYLRAVTLLYDLGLISREEFDFEIYGTSDIKQISLLKLGLSPGVVSILKEANQLKNIETNHYGNIYGNYFLKEYVESVDDFLDFEIKKYISFD